MSAVLVQSHNNLAKYTASVLSPLVGRTTHHIKNSQDFVKSISTITLEEDETITSYDVSALFTCIPPDDAVEVVREYLRKDTTLNQRTALTVEQI